MSNSNHQESISQNDEYTTGRSTIDRFLTSCVNASMQAAINQRENRFLRALGLSAIRKSLTLNKASSDHNTDTEQAAND